MPRLILIKKKHHAPENGFTFIDFFWHWYLYLQYFGFVFAGIPTQQFAPLIHLYIIDKKNHM